MNLVHRFLIGTTLTWGAAETARPVSRSRDRSLTPGPWLDGSSQELPERTGKPDGQHHP
jgi:hypothetical protein